MAKDFSTAYAMACRNRKKMAKGGMTQATEECVTRPDGGFGKVTVCDASEAPTRKAKGGMIDPTDSIHEAIRRKAKMMANGGVVDIEENNEEQPDLYPELNAAALDDGFDSTMDEDEDDDGSMSYAIRRKMHR